MGIFENNLKVLAEIYPEIDRLIEDARKETEESKEKELEIYREMSMDGEPILKVKKQDKEYYLGGKRNAKEPVDLWMEKSIGELAANAPVFIMGVGNSLYLSELINKCDEKIAILIYEPSLQLFLDFIEHTDITKWLRKQTLIFWVKGIKRMEIEQMKPVADQLLTYGMLPYSRNFVLPNYEVLFPEDVLEFLRMCRKSAMGGVVLRNTQKIFSKVVVKNLFINAKYLCDAYKTTQLVQVIPRDIPGIVVAAGPSLNKNIKDLKAACGKALIIAVDTAIKPLLKEGIKPDMVMIIDAVKPLELFQIDGCKDIPFICTMNASSEVMAYHEGKKFFFHEGYTFSEKILMKSKEDFGTIPSGGSVATNAFALLYKIGLTRIILVGQDLAYTNNRTHADGTFSEKMEEINTKGMYMVEGNCEDRVPTAIDLKQFLDWYNVTIPAMKKCNPDFCVINATEGGAKITDTEVMTLKEAISRECQKEVNIKECLDQLKPMLDQEERQWAVGYLKELPDQCHELTIQANKIKKLYKKLDKVCKKKNIDKKEYLSVLRRIDKSIPKIERMPMYQLATMSLSDAEYVISREQFLHRSTLAEEGKEIARKGTLYMELVEQCSNIFQKYAEEVFKDVE